MSARRRTRPTLLAPARLALGWVLALLLPVALTAGFSVVDSDRVALAQEVMLFLAGVVAVALVGGLWPAVATAVVSNLCLNWFFTQPVGRLHVSEPENALALAVFVVVAVAVASVVDLAARRTAQAARARAEASALAALARSVLSGEDTAQAVVERVAETFPVAHARLEERDDEGAPWHAVAAADGPQEPPAGGGARRAGVDAETEVRIDPLRRLLLRGRPLSAADRQAVEAFGAQAGIVLEHRRLRERAEQAHALELAEATRTALLAAVSHDLRTPLAATRAAVDGLAAHDVDLHPDDREALVGTIAESTTRLERLIGNLLDISRLQTGAVHPVLRPTSLEEVVPLAVEPWLDAIALDVPEDLPLVHTDAGLLERVVANLVSNAVRHAPDGAPALVTASASADRVELRVVDTGPGVPRARRQTMFEPFQRLDDTGADGLGLGLAVAAGLSRAIGAELVARDTPGGGLTMALSVPRAAATEAPRAADGRDGIDL
ncbi:DUF4118 domain-containing protein [Isoptericola variabilis]|uniref:histidine kinase n=1 Tax=Isoptericola variabilis (strain 225) TaxID=743718 RepID=F6FVZ1_ISOV2|nr:DUF4118 domain-containing protein [Isoptericola variabilis]AEG44461.1 integral membrane sensor signal transduction histidine kinase [Isoptericola variabilis 225]TWH28265.1 two-component system sensor histidine kinase KdpD [Isoptericola variabilis J7]